LGIGQLKWELEDYCFRYLHPAEYKRIAKLLHERRIDREHYIDEFVGHLRSEMKTEGVKAEVYGRPKHIYSIWRKMQKKQLAFDELFDVRAVRIVAERLQDCYAALGIVHTHYRHLPDEFDDYVANPKPNGYQSIHTVVLGPGGKPLKFRSVPNRCTKMPNWASRRTGSTKRAPLQARRALVMKIALRGCVS
jgi:GTP pyrophosphokinase